MTTAEATRTVDETQNSDKEFIEELYRRIGKQDSYEGRQKAREIYENAQKWYSNKWYGVK